MVAGLHQRYRSYNTREAPGPPEALALCDEHIVRFYETDDFLLNEVSGFMGAGLEVGHACIMIGTAAHRAGLEARLEASGYDLAAARLRGDYLALDAAETLAQFMVDDAPEPGRFAKVIGGVIARAAAGGRCVRAFGEMVALLWAEGNRAGALHLERLWNELQQASAPFSLFCAYPMHAFVGQEFEGLFSEICRQHSHVLPDEEDAALSSQEGCLRAIARLQQQALSLQAEAAERLRVEAVLDEQRQTEERKNASISLASHELKTPIAVLSGFTQLLQRRLKQADGPTLLLLARMAEQLKRLSLLVSDLLDVSSMQADLLPLRASRFALDDLVRETVESVQATTSHQMRMQGASAARLWGDRDRLGQVLLNLLTNAVKYSPKADRVLVRLRSDAAHAEVAVQDFGVGIAPEHHERIFERQYRVADGQEPAVPWLGLGLFLARQLVERHGGRVWLESRKGAGSTFYVRLPRV